MADVKTNNSASSVSDNASKKVVKAEEKFFLEDLKANYKAFNYSKVAVDGAFFNCNKTEMTKTEFKNTVDSFLKRKVE